jgi:hypothetical protein
LKGKTMTLIRYLLLVLIAWLAVRMVRVFLNIKHGPRQQEPEGGQPSGASRKGAPDDFSGDNIQDAEFEDLTPSPKTPSTPPKSS